jgi:glycosyltransferase involved in cell wall biosynthesis
LYQFQLTVLGWFASVIVEALAMGKPIIISDYYINYIDVEKEGIGFKILPGDVNGWKSAIQWMLNHPIEREEMGKRAIALANNKYNYELFSRNVIKKITVIKPSFANSYSSAAIIFEVFVILVAAARLHSLP